MDGVVCLLEYTGVAPSALDVTRTAHGNTLNTDTGTTTLTNQPSELWVGGITSNDAATQTLVTTGGFAEVAQQTTTNAQPNRQCRLLVAEKIVSTVGQAGFTSQLSGVVDSWDGQIASFKESVVTGQIGRPDATVSSGAWAATGAATLHQAINETTPSDTQYIQSSLSPVTPDVCEVGLGDVVDPTTSSGHFVRYRFAKSAASGDRVDLTVRLKQGATDIVIWDHTDISDSWITVDQPLTSEQADVITNYSDLRLSFEAART